MDRPRRTVRAPIKSPQLLVPEPSPRVIKRKPTPEPVDAEKLLKTLLESSKSDLVSRNMNDLINANTWSILSPDAQARLKRLLPPTAFLDARETIGSDHPSVEDKMVVDETHDNPTDTGLNPSFFNDPHFLAASRTFQDHLYLNWFSESHVAKVKQFQERIINGTLAAPWKDETWERDNPTPEEPKPNNVGLTSSFSESNILAGGSAEIKLYKLVKSGILQVGDVIAYRRCFTVAGVTVEKDSIIDFIHPKTYALTIRTMPGTAKDLPAHLLSHDAESDVPASPTTSSSMSASQTQNGDAHIQIMTITSPTMLETGLLDLDGRMEKGRRPNGNAWKSFTVWRWRAGAEHQPHGARGGRENHGTLFYLRSSYYHEM